MGWMDNTGLYQEWGVEQATNSKGGEYRNNGNLREIELKINLATLTESETILDNNITMPSGVRIAGIKVQTVTAAATGAAIDLGLIRTDRTTEVDYDGLLAAFPTATMNAANETSNFTVPNTAEAGALVGTTTSNPAHFTCSRTTATAFTAGQIIVTVYYFRP